MRIWLLSEDMLIKNFVDSFNDGIANNLTHTYEFPGKCLEKHLTFLVDEFNFNLKNQTIFIEIKKPGHKWIFNLESFDTDKFYK